MLSIPGGPGSDVPAGFFGRLVERESAHYVQAGYAVWLVTRARHMPEGHTVADMAEDYARFIREEIGGAVDVVLGTSFGGTIAMHLVAEHPELVGAVVLAGAAATIDEDAKRIDARWARLRAEGRHAEAGATLLELHIPGPRSARLRQLLGPAVGAAFARTETPPDDLLVEADAELSFDGRELLGRLTVPALLVCGEEDQFFSLGSVRETAAGFTDATVVTYPGRGHMAALSSSDLPRDVLAWLASRERETAATPPG